MHHLFLRRPPAHVSWTSTHTQQPTIAQRHLDGLPATRVRLLLEQARGESVEMSRARKTKEVPLSVVHLRLKACVALLRSGPCGCERSGQSAARASAARRPRRRGENRRNIARTYIETTTHMTQHACELLTWVQRGPTQHAGTAECTPAPSGLLSSARAVGGLRVLGQWCHVAGLTTLQFEGGICARSRSNASVTLPLDGIVCPCCRRSTAGIAGQAAWAIGAPCSALGCLVPTRLGDRCAGLAPCQA